MSNNSLREDIEKSTTRESRTSSPSHLGSYARHTSRHAEFTMRPSGNARDTEASSQQIDMTRAGAQQTRLNENINPRPAESNPTHLLGTHQQRHIADQVILDNAINQDKTSFVSRINSFSNGWFHDKTRARPKEFAEAGLFYTGESDMTMCFYCNGGLQKWDYDDVPWIEHARLYPKCEFVKAKKGIDFILHVTKACTKQDRAQGHNSPGFIAASNISASRHIPISEADIQLNRGKMSNLSANGPPTFIARFTTTTAGHNIVRNSLASPNERETPHASGKQFSEKAASMNTKKLKVNFLVTPIGVQRAKRGKTESDASPIVQGNPSDAETEPTPSYVFISDPTIERDRLASFANSHEPFVPSMRLAARQGLLFTGVGDTARCYSCNATWNISQGAYTTNLHQSDCQIRNQQLTPDSVSLSNVFDQFLESLQQGQGISQPAASSGESRDEPQAGPSSPKRQRGNDTRQFLQ